MKHLVIILSLLLVCYEEMLAQPPIKPTRRYEGTVDYQKTKQPATIMEFKYNENDLGNAMEAYLEKQGGKVKRQKGFNYVKGVRIHERENRYYDMYYKIEGSGKGDNANSKVYIILAEPGENILLREDNHAAAKTTAASVGAVSFYDGLGSEVGAYDYEKRVKEQEEEVAQAEKRMSELNKKRDKLTKDLDMNAQDISRQSAEIEKLKAILEQTKATRKKN
ncbi:MAG: hypothetical protein MUE58_02525 [Chitinophagaceae bacterium]|jgi:hypothetical protein|nr:hypothetical protein [Chitinophagaceae bacterium]